MRMNTMSRSKEQTKSTTTSSKINTYLILIVMVVLALSIVALFVAAETLLQGDTLTAGLFAGIGIIAMAMCMFLLFQSKRQSAEIKLDVPKVMTTIECQNKTCNNKATREFQRGDFVFKDLDVACGKCGGKQMITGVFKEVKEKEKTYAV
jgi:multidrug transporter EmrE-like cation transporter